MRNRKRQRTKTKQFEIFRIDCWVRNFFMIFERMKQKFSISIQRERKRSDGENQLVIKIRERRRIIDPQITILSIGEILFREIRSDISTSVRRKNSNHTYKKGVPCVWFFVSFFFVLFVPKRF